MKILIILLIFGIFFTSKAQAYIDPGSGSIILQALIGALAAAGATVSIYWEKFKNLFKKSKNKKDKK
jgi:uncharacterized membrane protein